jgi:hypothetical protein
MPLQASQLEREGRRCLLRHGHCSILVMRTRNVLRLAALVALTARQVTAATMDVTACGQLVPAGATGILRNDLDCPPGFPTVTLGHGATLRMSRHAIRGGLWLSCSRCKILGPGEISGASDCAIHTTANPTPADAGIVARDLDIHDNGLCAIGVPGRSRLKRVRIARSQFGILFVQGMEGSDVEIRETSVGIGCNATLACNEGLPDCLVRLRRLTAVDNGSGIFGCPLALRDSRLEGNDFYDFLTPSPPRLVRTACERSMASGGGSWSVCTAD